jgi:hypothetical protein
LFDNIPAPMIYTSATQVSAVVPFAVTGKASTVVRTEYNGAQSVALGISVVDSAPALFTANASGTGQIAALNEDYSVNSPSRPAEPNSIVQLYATGGGPWTESIPDGQVTGSHLVAPRSGFRPGRQTAGAGPVRRYRARAGQRRAANQYFAAQGADRRPGDPDTDLGGQLHHPPGRHTGGEIEILPTIPAVSAS